MFNINCNNPTSNGFSFPLEQIPDIMYGLSEDEIIELVTTPQCSEEKGERTDKFSLLQSYIWQQHNFNWLMPLLKRIVNEFTRKRAAYDCLKIICSYQTPPTIHHIPYELKQYFIQTLTDPASLELFKSHECFKHLLVTKDYRIRSLVARVPPAIHEVSHTPECDEMEVEENNSPNKQSWKDLDQLQNDYLKQIDAWQSSNKNSVPDTRLFAQIHGVARGSLLNGTEYAGNSFDTTIPYLVNFLTLLSKGDLPFLPTKTLNSESLELVIKDLSELLSWDQKLDRSDRKNRTRNSQSLESIGKEIKQKLTKEGKVVIPSGWMGLRGGASGHAMITKFEKDEKDIQTVTQSTFNTGSGLRSYHVKRVIENKVKYFPVFSKDKIPVDFLFPRFFSYLLGFEKFKQNYNEGQYRAEDIYNYFIKVLPGNIVDHSLEHDDKFISAQQGPHCSWAVLMAYLRYHIQQKDYVQIKCSIKLLSLSLYYLNFAKRKNSKQSQPNYTEWYLFKEATKNFSREVLNYFQKRLLHEPLMLLANQVIERILDFIEEDSSVPTNNLKVKKDSRYRVSNSKGQDPESVIYNILTKSISEPAPNVSPSIFLTIKTEKTLWENTDSVHIYLKEVAERSEDLVLKGDSCFLGVYLSRVILLLPGLPDSKNNMDIILATNSIWEKIPVKDIKEVRSNLLTIIHIYSSTPDFHTPTGVVNRGYLLALMTILALREFQSTLPQGEEIIKKYLLYRLPKELFDQNLTFDTFREAQRLKVVQRYFLAYGHGEFAAKQPVLDLEKLSNHTLVLRFSKEKHQDAKLQFIESCLDSKEKAASKNPLTIDEAAQHFVRLSDSLDPLWSVLFCKLIAFHNETYKSSKYQFSFKYEPVEQSGEQMIGLVSNGLRVTQLEALNLQQQEQRIDQELIPPLREVISCKSIRMPELVQLIDEHPKILSNEPARKCFYDLLFGVCHSSDPYLSYFQKELLVGEGALLIEQLQHLLSSLKKICSETKSIELTLFLTKLENRLYSYTTDLLTGSPIQFKLPESVLSREDLVELTLNSKGKQRIEACVAFLSWCEIHQQAHDESIYKYLFAATFLCRFTKDCERELAEIMDMQSRVLTTPIQEIIGQDVQKNNGKFLSSIVELLELETKLEGNWRQEGEGFVCNNLKINFDSWNIWINGNRKVNLIQNLGTSPAFRSALGEGIPKKIMQNKNTYLFNGGDVCLNYILGGYPVVFISKQHLKNKIYELAKTHHLDCSKISVSQYIWIETTDQISPRCPNVLRGVYDSYFSNLRRMYPFFLHQRFERWISIDQKNVHVFFLDPAVHRVYFVKQENNKFSILDIISGEKIADTPPKRINPICNALKRIERGRFIHIWLDEKKQITKIELPRINLTFTFIPEEDGFYCDRYPGYKIDVDAINPMERMANVLVLTASSGARRFLVLETGYLHRSNPEDDYLNPNIYIEEKTNPEEDVHVCVYSKGPSKKLTNGISDSMNFQGSTYSLLHLIYIHLETKNYELALHYVNKCRQSHPFSNEIVKKGMGITTFFKTEQHPNVSALICHLCSLFLESNDLIDPRNNLLGVANHYRNYIENYENIDEKILHKKADSIMESIVNLQLKTKKF